jgi:NTE family protein
MRGDIMPGTGKVLGLTLSGGGVKGIAYVGVFSEAESRGYRWGNIAGVSIGALAGAFAGAGYQSVDMWELMQGFGFKSIQLREIARLPVVSEFREFILGVRSPDEQTVRRFLEQALPADSQAIHVKNVRDGMRNMLSNIVTLCKHGSLFDGDYLEEWVSGILARKGIKTFADLRGGFADKINPGGYRVRMTGMDCNRVKTVVMPDDMEFYGIDPDSFDVAKAVRISTCVPFAFKPVPIKSKKNGKTYYLIDGGVFDTFPYWAVDNSYMKTVGFRLNGSEKKFFSLDTALDILKTLVSAVYDTGTPEKDSSMVDFIQDIDTQQVHFLDFNLGEEGREYLYNNGRLAAAKLFDRLEQKGRLRCGMFRNIPWFFRRFFR